MTCYWKLLWPTLMLSVLAGGCCSNMRIRHYASVRAGDRTAVSGLETAYWVASVRDYAAMSELSYEPVPLPEQRAKDREFLREHLVQNQWQVESIPEIQKVLTNETRRTGLAMVVWSNAMLNPPVLCVSFRGTEFTDWRDWASNFRFFTGGLSGQDQYKAARHPKIVAALLNRRDELEAEHGKKFDIVPTGHSLGGGLAQHFMYHSHLWTERPVERCVVFDPSPLTGWFQAGLPG
jgi:pimeloyl-ACP methyl ester carboxylesterase